MTSDILHVRLPKWRKEKIRRAANTEAETMSEFILRAVDKEIEQQRKKLEKITPPYSHN